MLNPLGPSHQSQPSRLPSVVGGSSILAQEADPLVVPEDSFSASQLESTSEAKPDIDTRPRHIEGEVIIKTSSSLFKSDQQSLIESLGAKVAERFEFPEDLFKSFDGEVVRLQLPQGLSTEEALSRLKDDPRVELAVPNEIIYLDEAPDEGEVSQGNQASNSGLSTEQGRIPNDLDPKLWGLHNVGQDGGRADADIDAPEAWERTVGSQDVVIAVLDTGVDYNHPDLKDNIWRNPKETANGKDDDGNGIIDDVFGYNAFANTGDPMDGHSHGTHVAGTIAARGDNGEGITGVNWKAQIMPIKIFDDSGRTTSDAILRGLLYATKNGARITNNSWGGPQANQLIQEAFEKSSAFHVMAAGNNGTNNDQRPFFPNNYDLGDNSIRVAATDRNDNLARFSNFGPGSVDLGAPGVQIYSTMPGGGYANKSGTSMAAPHVAGVAGLLVANNPQITNDELKERLMNGAERLNSLAGKVATNRRLNASNALDDEEIAPGELRSLEGRATGPNGVVLSFLAPGDDEFEGRATSYDVRVSDAPIETLEQYLAAPLLTIAKPKDAGEQEHLELKLTPQTQGRDLYFAVQAFDNVSNASPLAQVKVSVPAADVAFAEEVTPATSGWQMEGSWGLHEVDGRTVFSDSPGQNYPSRADHALTSPTIDLSSFSGSTLIFEALHQLEEGYDKVELEVAQASVEEPEWTTLRTFTGGSDWATQILDLSEFDGQKVQVRFRLQSDQSYEEEGFSFANFQVLGQRA